MLLNTKFQVERCREELSMVGFLHGSKRLITSLLFLYIFKAGIYNKK